MRNDEKLMGEWQFRGSSGTKKTVTLSHTWNNLDGQDGGNDYLRGSCLYEKSLQNRYLHGLYSC